MADLPPFARAARERMAQQSLGLRAFSRQIGQDPGNVQRVLQGQRLPPLMNLQPWVNTLAKDDVDRRHLIRLALEAHGLGWIPLEP